MKQTNLASLAVGVLLATGSIAFPQNYSGVVPGDRIEAVKAKFDEELLYIGYKLDPASFDIGSIYFCGFGPLDDGGRNFPVEVDSFSFLFPELSEPSRLKLWNAIEFLSALEVGLKLGGADGAMIDGLLDSVYLNIQFEEVFLSFNNDPEMATREQIVAEFRRVLQTSEAQRLESSVHCLIELVEPNYVPLVVARPGARVYWSTPFREKICSVAVDADSCAWIEVTGASKVIVEGTRVFLARWPDGTSVRATYSGSDAPAVVSLGG